MSDRITWLDTTRTALITVFVMLASACAPAAVTVLADTTSGGRPSFTGHVQLLAAGVSVPAGSELLGHVCVRAPSLSYLPTMWEAAAAEAARLGANTIQRVSQIDANAARLFIPGVGATRAANGASTGLPIIPPKLHGCYAPRALLIARAYWVPDRDSQP